MIKKKIISVLLAISMIASMSMTVFAEGGDSDEILPPMGSGIVTTPDSPSEVPVELTQDATIFSVTVPTYLPVDVDSTGAVMVSVHNKIINNSFGPVEIKSVEVQPLNDWSILNINHNFKGLKVGSKQFGFQLNGTDVETDGSCNASFPIIDGKSEISFTYNAKIAPQNTTIIHESIANVVFTMGWYSEGSTVKKPMFTMVHRPSNTITTVTDDFNITFEDVLYYDEEYIDIIHSLGYNSNLYNSNEYYSKIETVKLINHDFLSIDTGEMGIISVNQDLLGKTLGELGNYSVMVDWPEGRDLIKTEAAFSIQSYIVNGDEIAVPAVSYTWYYADGRIEGQSVPPRKLWFLNENTKTFTLGTIDTVITANMVFYVDGDNVLWDIAIGN